MDQLARREFYLRIYFSGSQRLRPVTIRVCAALGNSEAVVTTE